MKSKDLMRLFVTLLLGVLLLTAGNNVLGQDATGRLVGTITDQQNAVIAGAKVTVTNTATGVSRDAITNKDGYFEVLLLPIGNYKVTVEKDGFKKAVTDEQKLLINQSLRLDLSMQAGGANEQIDVTAQAAQVETVNPTLGQSITSRPIVNLPLNGRNVLQLALLQPGVAETTGPSSGGFSIAGGRGDSVTYLLDGGVNNNLLSNLQVFNPNPDTIAEFRLLTSNYTAEYGRNGGGIVSVVTKSGTNSYHGSGFEFLRNDALNANTFFHKNNPATALPRDILKRNQFGFTIGGPITIPKVLEGKDRFFFFVGYQGQRLTATQTATSTTFTPAELAGDFSHSGSGGTVDTAVANYLLAHPFFQANPALAAQGIIDPNKFNSVAKKYITNKLIPTAATGTLQSQGGQIDNNDELTIKTDFVITSKDRLGVTLGSGRNPLLTPFSGGANVPGYGITGNNFRKFANIAYTRVFSPTLINEFRFTAQRIDSTQAVPSSKLPVASDLGVGITPDNPTGPPRLSFGSGLTIGFSPQGPTRLVNNTFITSDTVSWIKGPHNLKMGGSFSPYQNNTVFDFFVNGNFFFDSLAGGGIGSGTDRADFLMGLPDEYLQFGAAPSDIRSKSFYLFGQDEWHVRKNLTVTLGLRYEYSQPKRDSQGRSFSLKFAQKSTVFTGAPNGLLFPGDAGAPNGANFPDKNDFAPRLGFAWDPKGDGKTSIRGGIGVFYDILKGEDNLQFNGQAPFFGFADLFFDPLSGNPATEVNYLTQPFVATGVPNSFPSKPPASNINFAASGFAPFGGGGVFFVDPNLRTPYTYQYNLSIQRQLRRSLTAEASYVGSSSRKLTSLVDANPFILGTTNRILNTAPGNNSGSFSFLDDFKNVSSANFNSMELSLQKQLSTDGKFGSSYFTVAYTYAHSIDNSSGFRQRNSAVPVYSPNQFRASSDFDIRHRFTFSGGWDLPFDKLWSNGPKALLKGWSVYPIVSSRTGFPLDIFAGLSRSGDRPGPSASGDGQLVRVNITGNTVTIFDPHKVQTFTVSAGSQNGNYYFDPTVFNRTGLSSTSLAPVTNPALRTYGTLPRNFFRALGRTNADIAFAKTTPIFKDKVNLEFKAEFFNIFNNTEFGSPSTSFTSSLFGKVTSTFDPRIIQFALRLSF